MTPGQREAPAPTAEPDRATALARERQRIAHEGTGYVPAWEQLTDHERHQSVIEAGWWLSALARVDAAASPSPAVPEEPQLPPEPPKGAVVPGADGDWWWRGPGGSWLLFDAGRDAVRSRNLVGEGA